jgi:hypothetical protein
MSVTAVSKFRYFCTKYISFDRHTKIPKIGQKIPALSVPWWQVAFEGLVTEISYNPSGRFRVTVEFIGFPVNGDKFTTFHGQKGVATILP